MFSFLSDDSFMNVFRTYWPLCTVAIAGFAYLFRQRKMRRRLRELLGHELLENTKRLNSVTPAVMPPEDAMDFIDSIRALIPLRNLFSLRVYDQYLASLYILTEPEKIRLFEAYNYLQAMLGSLVDAAELLSKEQRTKHESHELVKQSTAIGLMGMTVLTIHYSSLEALGYHSQVEHLKARRGDGLQQFRKVNDIFAKTPKQ